MVCIILVILRFFRHSTPASVDHLFRRGQLISAAAYSLGHGTNDAQKTMGIIAGALFTVPAYRYLVSDMEGQLTIPFWIVLMAHAAIGLGTLSGGWRIVRTMGSRITRLQPIGGFAAEAAGAITIFIYFILAGKHFGSVSTTQNNIQSRGAMARSASAPCADYNLIAPCAVNVAGRIVWAWIAYDTALPLLHKYNKIY